MYLLTSLGEADPTKAAILRAGLELLAEKGYKGAITREIAIRAGTSEVTLFRHYKSKQELMREAINSISPPIEQLLPSATGDFEADLTGLVGNINALIEANKGFVIRLLPELMRHPELHSDGQPKGFLRAFGAGRDFLAHYQKAGLLSKNELPEQMVLALIGPLVARVLLAGAWGIELPLDLQAHVKGFLQGRRAHAKR